MSGYKGKQKNLAFLGESRTIEIGTLSFIRVFFKWGPFVGDIVYE